MKEQNFDDFTTSKPSILGSTTINHAARIKLGLTCSEYVLMNYIYHCVTKKREVDIMETYRQTGFEVSEQEVLLRKLIQKRFIFPENEAVPRLTGKWETAFTDIEMEFENLFWKKDGKVIWTGSKKKSCDMYIRLRKKYSRDFLLEQKDQYLRLLELENKHGFDRRIMMAERWLNPSNEYYLTDWKSQADQLDKKISEAENRIKKSDQKFERKELTNEQRRRGYQEDSNE